MLHSARDRNSVSTVLRGLFLFILFESFQLVSLTRLKFTIIRFLPSFQADLYFYVSYYFSIFRNSRFLPIKARASKALSFGLLAGMAFGKMSSNSKGHPEPGTYHQVTQIESARLATERICKFCLGMACISLGFLAPVIWDG